MTELDDTGMDEIVRQFLVETSAALAQLDQDLVALEQEPGSPELLDRVFRALHTIKGNSGALAYTQIEQMTHAGEEVLSRLRDRSLSLTPQTTSLLLRLVDAVSELLRQIENTGVENLLDRSSLLATLAALVESPPQPASTPELPLPGSDLRVVIPSPPGLPHDADAPPLGQVLVDRGAITPDAVTLAVMEQAEGDDRPLGEILVRHGAATAAAVSDALELQSEVKRTAAGSTLHVHAEVVDSLMRLVDELAVVRVQVTACARDGDMSRLREAARELAHVTEELQWGVRTLRAQPVEGLWRTLSRVVRDVAVECGKQVRLQTTGGDTAIDRTILEQVKDPLIHCARNAIDHGIESAEHRIAVGKPAAGTLRLSATLVPGHVRLEVSDDGRGIDPTEVGRCAVQRGVLSAARLRRLTDQQVVDLVLLPGFSTAGHVTHMSGRGVGLDVVHANVAGLDGTVEVDSRPGQGTTLRLTIPLPEHRSA